MFLADFQLPHFVDLHLQWFLAAVIIIGIVNYLLNDALAPKRSHEKPI